MTVTMLLALLLLAVLVGGFGHRDFGWYGWSPLGIVFVIVLVLVVTGRIR